MAGNGNHLDDRVEEKAPCAPPGRELAWKNRRVSASRLRWPEGAAGVCEQVERKHPGWYPSYSAGGTRARPEAGFFAVPWRQHRLRFRRSPLSGAGAAELSAAIEEFEAGEER